MLNITRLILKSSLFVFIGASISLNALADDNAIMVKCKYKLEGKDTLQDISKAECKQKKGDEVKIRCKGTKDGEPWIKDMNLQDCKEKGGTEMMVKCKGKDKDTEWVQEFSLQECKDRKGDVLDSE